MKKFLSLILALVMVASLLAGCGNSGGGGGSGSGSGSASGSGASSGPVSGTPTSLSMATGGTSGTYYGFSGVLAQVLNEKLGGDRGIHLTYAAGYSDNFFSFYPASIELQHRGFGDWLFFRFG